MQSGLGSYRIALDFFMIIPIYSIYITESINQKPDER